LSPNYNYNFNKRDGKAKSLLGTLLLNSYIDT
jgi:hypothetical protein